MAISKSDLKSIILKICFRSYEDTFVSDLKVDWGYKKYICSNKEIIYLGLTPGSRERVEVRKWRQHLFMEIEKNGFFANRIIIEFNLYFKGRFWFKKILNDLVYKIFLLDWYFLICSCNTIWCQFLSIFKPVSRKKLDRLINANQF